MTAAELAAQYARLAEARDQIEAQLSEVKAAIRELGVGTFDAGPLTITVRPNRRFDMKAAAHRFDQEAYPNLWVFTLDTMKLKAMLSPDDLNSLMVEVGEPVVVVK